jgi:hypothetical protein
MQITYVSPGAGYTPLTAPYYLRQFLKTKTYQYILEQDENGNVIGGEWVGNSKTDHPDFAWFPIARPGDSSSILGIRYDIVRGLIMQSRNC